MFSSEELFLQYSGYCGTHQASGNQM